MTMTAGMTAPTPDRAHPWRNYAAGAAVLGLLFIGRASWDIGEDVHYAADGVVTEARLVGITHVPEGPGHLSHYARVRYVAGGKPIIVRSENRIVPARHELGDVLQVTYLSGNPGRVRLAEGGGSTDGRTWLSLGLGATASLSGLFGLLRSRRQA
jgi:hypothetical protein